MWPSIIRHVPPTSPYVIGPFANVQIKEFQGYQTSIEKLETDKNATVTKFELECRRSDMLGERLRRVEKELYRMHQKKYDMLKAFKRRDEEQRLIMAQHQLQLRQQNHSQSSSAHMADMAVEGSVQQHGAHLGGGSGGGGGGPDLVELLTPPFSTSHLGPGGAGSVANESKSAPLASLRDPLLPPPLHRGGGVLPRGGIGGGIGSNYPYSPGADAAARAAMAEMDMRAVREE